MKYVDPEAVTLEEGKFLVELARNAITKYLTEDRIIDPPSSTPLKLKKFGASFVTLTKKVNNEEELRGCIGYTKPIEPLVNNVIHAAIAAATQDPRFLPVSKSEIRLLIVEVSVLSPPELLDGSGEKLLLQFVIGRDGLIVEKGFYSGLLLPEVPIEYCWDKETFLSETCIKAGLSPSCWLDEDTKVYRFRTAAFKEKSPSGNVMRRDLVQEYEYRCMKI